MKFGVGIGSVGNGDKIIGNTVDSLSNMLGIGIGVWVTAGNTLIEGNTITNLSGTQAHGIALAAQNCTVKDNTIDTVTGGDGIKLYDSAMLGLNGGTIAGNQKITGNTIKNITNGIGINLTDNDNNKVLDNKITNTGQDGIFLCANPLRSEEHTSELQSH